MKVKSFVIASIVSGLTAAAHGSTIILQNVLSQSSTFQPTSYDEISTANVMVDNVIQSITTDHYLRISSSAEIGIVRTGGWLDIKSGESTASGYYDNSAQIGSTAIWDDYLTVGAREASEIGKSAVLKIQLELHGGSIASSSSVIGGISSDVKFSFFTNATGELVWEQTVFQSGTDPLISQTSTPFGVSENLSGVYDISIPVIIGDPLYFALSIHGGISGRAVGGGFVSGAYEYDKSLYWAGAPTLQMDGEYFSDFVITSSSGRSLKETYVSQISEPAVSILALLGIGFVAMVGRKSRAQIDKKLLPN